MSLVKQVDMTHKKRLVIIGDLHGEYDKFMDILNNEIDFDYDEDHVISVGDLVDRGSQSLECFNLTFKSWFTAVRGNHEQFCIDGVQSKEAEENHQYNGGEWFYQLPKDVQMAIAQQANKLPIMLEVKRHDKTYGFIHADLNNQDSDWNITKEKLLNYDERTLQECIWGRTRISLYTRGCNLKPIQNIDEVFLGHTIVKNPIEIHNTNYIDTGFYHTGKLTYVLL